MYWRTRTGTKRAYGDFRDYADVGGGREALIANGEKRATTDPTVAQLLIARRLEQLENHRRGRAIHGIAKQATLAESARLHLIAKAESGMVTDDWLACQEIFLQRAVDFLGADRDLASIGVEDARKWSVALASMPNGHGSAMSSGTVRHHLNALSNLYRRAQAEGYVLPGYNPVSAMLDKPSAHRQEAKWLEVDEAALLLEAARTHRPPLGLEVQDVSFDRQIVTFRPNEWRRLKTGTSHRSVPLWPQLEEILRPYVFGSGGPPGCLLFPSLRMTREAMITDFRKLLDSIAKRAGWNAGEIRSKMFRHTYCAARLQTLDHGAPVSPYTVAKELGHGGEAMVRRVYGHLGAVRHRAEVVEYRVEQHRARLTEN